MLNNLDNPHYMTEPYYDADVIFEEFIYMRYAGLAIS